jgi:hypothetical protein
MADPSQTLASVESLLAHLKVSGVPWNLKATNARINARVHAMTLAPVDAGITFDEGEEVPRFFVTMDGLFRRHVRLPCTAGEIDEVIDSAEGHHLERLKAERRLPAYHQEVCTRLETVHSIDTSIAETIVWKEFDEIQKRHRNGVPAGDTATFALYKIPRSITLTGSEIYTLHRLAGIATTTIGGEYYKDETLKAIMLKLEGAY